MNWNNDVPELVVEPDECIHWFLGRHPEGHVYPDAGNGLGDDHLKDNTHSSLHRLDLVVQSFNRMFHDLCDGHIMFDSTEFKYLHEELKLYVRELDAIKERIAKAFKQDQYSIRREAVLNERKLTRLAKRFFISEWAHKLCMGKLKLELSDVTPNNHIRESVSLNWRPDIKNLINVDGSLVEKEYVKIDQMIDTEVKQKVTEIHEAYSKRYNHISSELYTSNMKKLRVMSLVLLMIIILPSLLLWRNSLKTYTQLWEETRYKYWHDFSNYTGWVLGERLRNSTWLLNDQEKEDKGTEDVVCQSNPRAELWFYSMYFKPYDWEEVPPPINAISEGAMKTNPTLCNTTVEQSEKPIKLPSIQLDLFLSQSKPMCMSLIEANNSQPLTVVDTPPDSISIDESLDSEELEEPYLLVRFVKWLIWLWVWLGVEIVLISAILKLLSQAIKKMNSKLVKRDPFDYLFLPTLIFSRVLVFYLMTIWYSRQG